MCIGNFSSTHNFQLCSVRFRISDILSNRTVEQECLLQHYTDLTPKVRLANISDIHPIDGDGTLICVIESANHVDEGRLPST
ncbi:hypothetical protein D3C76_1486850 [compost metagenome]